MNFFIAKRSSTGGSLTVDVIDFKIKPPDGCPAQIKLGIRPNDLCLDECEGCVALEVAVESVEFSGATYIVYAKLGNAPIRAELPRRVDAGAHLPLFLDPARVHLFDPTTGRRIDPR